MLNPTPADPRAGLDLPDSFTIQLPPRWEGFPLDPDELRRFATKRAASLHEHTALSRGEIRKCEILLAELRALLTARRTMLAALYTGYDEPTDDAPDGTIVLAYVVGAMVHRREIGSAVPFTADVLVRALTDPDLAGEDRTIRHTDLEPPAVVELGDAKVAQLSRLTETRVDAASVIKQFVRTYFIPTRTGDGAVMLQFGTVNYNYARQFAELFEKVTATVHLYYPEDPTFSDDAASDGDVDGATPVAVVAQPT